MSLGSFVHKVTHAATNVARVGLAPVTGGLSLAKSKKQAVQNLKYQTIASGAVLGTIYAPVVAIGAAKIIAGTGAAIGAQKLFGKRPPTSQSSGRDIFGNFLPGEQSTGYGGGSSGGGSGDSGMATDFFSTQNIALIGAAILALIFFLRK